MRPLRIVLLLASLGAVQAHAGIFDDDEARRQLAEFRQKTEARFDQQAKAQLDLAGQIQQKSEEIARLRGQVETLSYELETARKRQQDFYLDLDTRVRKFEAPPVAAADSAGGANATAAADTARETQEYEAALAHFKGARYKDASTSFAAFVQKFPNSQLAPNAQYWMGNAWMMQQDCKRAIEAQTVVTTKYPDSPKAPDAWLAIASCQRDTNNLQGARRSLQTLVTKYPNAPAAEQARERLKK